jgi:hypothetical protein
MHPKFDIYVFMNKNGENRNSIFLVILFDIGTGILFLSPYLVVPLVVLSAQPTEKGPLECGH